MSLYTLGAIDINAFGWLEWTLIACAALAVIFFITTCICGSKIVKRSERRLFDKYFVMESERDIAVLRLKRLQAKTAKLARKGIKAELSPEIDESVVIECKRQSDKYKGERDGLIALLNAHNKKYKKHPIAIPDISADDADLLPDVSSETETASGAQSYDEYTRNSVIGDAESAAVGETGELDSTLNSVVSELQKLNALESRLTSIAPRDNVADDIDGIKRDIEIIKALLIGGAAAAAPNKERETAAEPACVISEPVQNTDELAEVLIESAEEPEKKSAAAYNAMGIYAVAEEMEVSESEDEESEEVLKARYKVFDYEDRLRDLPHEMKLYYSEIKNHILSYKGVKSRISKKYETFSIGKFTLCKLAVKGESLRVYLAIDSESADSKYKLKNMSDNATYESTPSLLVVKSQRALNYSLALTDIIMETVNVDADSAYEKTDYAAQYKKYTASDYKETIRDGIVGEISADESDILSDEDAYKFIDIEKSSAYKINKFKPINKYVLYTDDLAALMSAGDTVDIGVLKSTGVLPEEDNIFLEIRHRGVLDKPLTVKAHSFSLPAVKMITLVDGLVVRYK